MLYIRKIKLRFQGVDLSLERLVLGLLSLNELTGQSDLFRDSLRGQQIDVAELVLRLAKVLHLYQALVDEGVEAVVQPPNAHAELVGQLALGQVRVVLQDAHDPKMGVFLDLGLAACHGGSFRVVLMRRNVLRAGYRSAVSRSALRFWSRLS